MELKKTIQDNQEIFHAIIIPFIRHFKMQMKLSILTL